ncbi:MULTISPECIES: hypothetical protein [unclassified Arthrobacter]|uniref:hypothetical protein n=1 Tax=unclassified Arthrobacter TaxID=235627 RepID=UPI003390AF16
MVPTGHKIGSIGQIYVDDHTSEPTWVTVKTGLFGSNESFAPIGSATQEGSDLVVPYTKTPRTSHPTGT